MTDLNHGARRWWPVTLSNEKAPSPVQACHAQHPPCSGRLGAAQGRHTADCQSRSTRPGRIHDHDLTTGSVHSPLTSSGRDDGIRRHS
jgi:hypothetical protein